MIEMSNWVDSAKYDPHAFFGSLYSEYRDSCCIWLQSSYNVNQEDSIDIFQQTILILYDNIQRKKVTFDNHASVKTYLYGIAKNLAKDNKRRVSKWSKIKDPEDVYKSLVDDSFNASLLEDADKQIIIQLRKAIVELGDTCKNLLTLFYYNTLNMEEIAQQLNYSNAASAKAQKYKCLKRLKKSININYV